MCQPISLTGFFFGLECSNTRSHVPYSKLLTHGFKALNKPCGVAVSEGKL